MKEIQAEVRKKKKLKEPTLKKSLKEEKAAQMSGDGDT